MAWNAGLAALAQPLFLSIIKDKDSGTGERQISHGPHEDVESFFNVTWKKNGAAHIPLKDNGHCFRPKALSL